MLLTDTEPMEAQLSKQPSVFANVDITKLSGEDLMLVIAERYNITSDGPDGPALWGGDADHVRAKEAMSLGLLPKAQKELIAAFKEYESLVAARQNDNSISGEQLQELIDAHTRFWFAKKAGEAVSSLIAGHFLNLPHPAP